MTTIACRTAHPLILCIRNLRPRGAWDISEQDREQASTAVIRDLALMSTPLSQAAFDGLLEKATVRLRDELLLELSQQLRMTTKPIRGLELLALSGMVLGCPRIRLGTSNQVGLPSASERPSHRAAYYKSHAICHGTGHGTAQAYVKT